MARSGSNRAAEGRRVRLKPKNDFDLLRLIARSQNEPRKAVAELVQNSLDAGARHVHLEWFNERGRRALRITDDGSGVFPNLEREDALLRIARTIGHSHKRDLSPGERRELMVLGQYGIGLLGFWSVGEQMEIKSRVGGGEIWCLRMFEEQPEGKVLRARPSRLDTGDTWTQVTIRGVHEAVLSKVRPPRLQAYLAQELRGQLLEREVAVTIHDRVARGRATKHFHVRPKPFLGVPLEAWRTLEVPGFDDARLDLYLVSDEEERRGVVALTCGGAVVLDDIASLEGEDAPRTPWDSGQLEGTIDFPDLAVAPSTRRGFTANPASAAFFDALARLELELLSRILDDNERRAEERQRTVARQLRRLFRPIARELPEYELLRVEGGAGSSESAPGSGAALGPAGVEPELAEGESVEPPAPSAEVAPPTPEQAEDDPGMLFPPGPMASVRLTPARARMAPSAERRLRVRAFDGDGRPAAGDVSWRWELEGPGTLDADGAHATYASPDDEGRATIRAIGEQADQVASADALITITEQSAGGGPRGGVPEPTPVHAPSEPWRSRLVGERWEFNSGHPDYRLVEPVEARRVRYLSHLYAKEIVLRNFGGLSNGEVLERMVQMVTRLGTR